MTTPLGPTTGTAATTERSGSLAPALGKEDFLKLLVAQLRNQDPMSPMDGSEFAAQLAQFSTVEQLIEIGSKLDGQAGSIAESALTTQTMLGSSLIGRDVLLKGATLASNGEDPPRIAIDLDGAADQVVVEVLGDDGKVIATREFSDQPGGRGVLTLDGIDLDAGSYNYQVTATTKDGSVVGAEGYTIGQVEGMSFVGGRVTLRIDGVLVPMVDILEVISAGSSAPQVPSTQESSRS